MTGKTRTVREKLKGWHGPTTAESVADALAALTDAIIEDIDALEAARTPKAETPADDAALVERMTNVVIRFYPQTLQPADARNVAEAVLATARAELLAPVSESVVALVGGKCPGLDGVNIADLTRFANELLRGRR